jgi:hypothetical protein
MSKLHPSAVNTLPNLLSKFFMNNNNDDDYDDSDGNLKELLLPSHKI